MKLDLAVIGQGLVSPAGFEFESLHADHPAPVPTAGLRRPDLTWPVLRVDLKSPQLQRWQREPRLRRSSPITLFLIEAAEQALAGVSAADRAQTGLIIAFSAGCLAYSRRFFEAILKEGQNRASPALFPETVFNSPGSHVASALKLNGAVYALVGDEGAWAAALQTAAIWLRQKRVPQVLVLGAEEFDPLALDAYRSARWLRRGFIPSEGAAGLLIRPAKSGDGRVITTAHDGFIYRTPQEAATAAEKLFRTFDSNLPCYPTARETWLGTLERKMLHDRRSLSNDHPPHLGEAFTASAAWNTLRSLSRLSGETPALTLPLWGLNHQLAALELRGDTPACESHSSG
jgi:3-oxoacyl-(acyl-carrier-protein) synthase